MSTKKVPVIQWAGLAAPGNGKNVIPLFVYERPPLLFVSDYTAISSPTYSSGANAGSSGTAISSDGTKVAFVTQSTNLVSGATNNCVVVFNRTTSTYTLCSSGLTGVSRPSISRDGRYVAFYGLPSMSASTYPYAYDLTSGTRSSPSVLSTTASVDFPPQVSNSVGGNYTMVFPSLENLLKPKGGGPVPKPILAWTVGSSSAPVEVSFNATGTSANADCSQPVISADGTLVAFVSKATNLVGNTGGGQQVFLSNFSSSVWRTNEAVSKYSTGTLFGDLYCTFPSMSADGDTIAFEDWTGVKNSDVWVRKRSSNSTFVPYPTSAPYNSGPNQMTTQPSVSPNGEVIAYQSFHVFSPNVASVQQLDTYPDGMGGTFTVGYLGSMLWVQSITSTSPIYIETYHGSAKLFRGGNLPCLSNDGSILAFDAATDRLLGETDYPTYGHIYIRTGASW